MRAFFCHGWNENRREKWIFFSSSSQAKRNGTRKELKCENALHRQHKTFFHLHEFYTPKTKWTDSKIRTPHNSPTHEQMPNTQFDKLITGNKKKGKRTQRFVFVQRLGAQPNTKAASFLFLLIADHYRSNLIVTFVLTIKHRNSFFLSNGFFIFMQIKNDIQWKNEKENENEQFLAQSKRRNDKIRNIRPTKLKVICFGLLNFGCESKPKCAFYFVFRSHNQIFGLQMQNESFFIR